MAWWEILIEFHSALDSLVLQNFVKFCQLLMMLSNFNQRWLTCLYLL